MSRDASVTLPWADGEYKFRLGIGQQRELEEKCNAGLQWIFERLAFNQHGGARLDDVRETIRLGLIGGGSLTPIKVLTLLKRYVDERPRKESELTAQAIIAAALVGAPEEADSLGKDEAADANRSNRSNGGKHDSPPSTESGPVSASILSLSTQ